VAEDSPTPSHDGGSRPIPDPTVLTTQALRREIEGLKELLIEKIKGEHDLMVEKFEAVERLRVEQKRDTQSAVDAALSAAKEAVAKSETAVGKQLEQQQATSNTAIGDLRRAHEELRDREIDDVKDLRRGITDTTALINGVTNQKLGAKEDRTGLYAVLGAVGVILGILIVISNFATGAGT
jgi:serine/threonine protein kinase HipA of HipAB toxin-antitoxin module